MYFNGKKLSGLTRDYQLDELFSILIGVLGGIFYFYSTFDRKPYKQTVHFVVPYLSLHCWCLTQ